MKHYTRIFTLLTFFCALNFQMAKAAASADPEVDAPTLSRIAQQFPSFQEQVTVAFTAVNPDASAADPSSFEFNWGMLAEGQRNALTAIAQEYLPLLEAEEASAAAAHKFSLADAAAASIGTRFDPTHPIFPRVMTLSDDVRTNATKFEASLKGCHGWNVHRYNKERISNVGADRLLFNTIIPGLGIAAGKHADNIARVRTLAERIYAGNAGKIASVNAVLRSLTAGAATGGDGLQSRPIHAAMAQVLTLAEQANAALDNTDVWLRIFLDKIAENIETGGGCLPGIMGRLVEVGMRAFRALAKVAPIADGISKSTAVPASGGFGGGAAEAEPGDTAVLGAEGFASASSDSLAGATDEERVMIESIAGGLGLDVSSKAGGLEAYRKLVADGVTGDALTERFTDYLLK